MTRLTRVRHELLALHRALLAAERITYERVHGRVSAGAFLELVIGAAEFAWLRPMTALIVAIDEVLDDKLVLAARDEADYLADVRKLLVPDPAGSEFERRYAAALHEVPDVVLAHGAVMRELP